MYRECTTRVTGKLEEPGIHDVMIFLRTLTYVTLPSQQNQNVKIATRRAHLLTQPHPSFSYRSSTATEAVSNFLDSVSAKVALYRLFRPVVVTISTENHDSRSLSVLTGVLCGSCGPGLYRHNDDDDDDDAASTPRYNSYLLDNHHLSQRTNSSFYSSIVISISPWFASPLLCCQRN